MGKVRDTCYMCSAVATSSEHVPPRCLFPEKKYLPELDDQRRDLITVPACDKHNTQKSGDDEYLMYLLSMSSRSSTYSGIIFDKAVRAARRRPQLSQSIFENKIVINDQDAYEVDRERVDASIGYIARAIFFSETNFKWIPPIHINSHIYNVATEQDGIEIDRDDILRNRNIFSNNVASCLSDCKWRGANPQIFRYKFYFDGSVFMVMQFCFFDQIYFEAISHPELWILDFGV